MRSDGELLSRYTESSSEDAFAELVRRHLDLVYSTALRQVNGDAHLAQDVAQLVFTDLARKARSLVNRKALAGWLYTAAHYGAAKAVRAEQRRHSREQEAHAMQGLLGDSGPGPDWEVLRSVLDSAMHELDEGDREVIVLRYFQNRPHADIGEQLGLSGNTARMRIERALDKLQLLLKRRGVTTTAAGLSVVMGANAVQAAPAGLAATISTAAIIGGTSAAATATVTAAKAIAMTTLQKTIIGATFAAVVGTGIYEARQAAEARAEAVTLHQQQIPLTNQIQQLQRERDEATNRAALLVEENARLRRNPDELLKLRGQVGALQNQLQAAMAATRRTGGATDTVQSVAEAAGDIEAKIVELSRNGTTVNDVLRVMGEPKEYLWGNKTFKKDELASASNYILAYPDGVAVWVGRDGMVRELRSEGEGPGFTYQGALRLGSSLDEALAVLGPPSKTVEGKPLAFEDGVLYKDIEERSGHCYYGRSDKNVRMFFLGNKVTALYITLGKGSS